MLGGGAREVLALVSARRQGAQGGDSRPPSLVGDGDIGAGRVEYAILRMRPAKKAGATMKTLRPLILGTRRAGRLIPHSAERESLGGERLVRGSIQ